jgi:putative transposase
MSLPGLRLGRELDTLVKVPGHPLMIVSDTGNELTSPTILRWREQSRVEWRYLTPRGKPTQNGFVESLTERLRGECLNERRWGQCHNNLLTRRLDAA